MIFSHTQGPGPKASPMGAIALWLLFALLSPQALADDEDGVVSIALTPEERSWVAENAVVVGIEQWPPLVFTNPTGEPDGLAVDYLKLIGERTGLRFSYTQNLWSYLLNGLKSREIDLLPATYYTDERATYGLYSTPYFQMREFFYVKTGRSDIQKSDDLREGTIAVVRDYGTIPKLREAYPGATILETEDLLKAILTVLDGKADAVLDSQVAVQHEMNTSAVTGLTSIPITAFTPSPIHLFSRIDQPLLQSILQKGLDSISDDERQSILAKWLHLSAQGNDSNAKRNVVYLIGENRSIWLIGLGTAFAVLLLSVVASYLLPRIISDRQIAEHVGSKYFRFFMMGATGILVFIVISLVWFTLEDGRKVVINKVMDDLEHATDNAQREITSWLLEREKFYKSLTWNPHLVANTRWLLLNQEELLPTSAPEVLDVIQEDARTFFAEIALESRSSEFAVVSPEGVTIGSHDNDLIGRIHPVFDAAIDAFNQALGGKVKLIYTSKTTHRDKNDQGETNSATIGQLHFATPVQDELGRNIAVLLQKVDTNSELSRLMLLGGLGRSGESYLVSPDGLMLTRSRFYSSLTDYGLVKASDEHLPLKDPGRDLVAEHHRLNANGQNKRVKSNRLDDRDIAGEQSFTVMVERLLDGKTHSFEETDSPENFTVWIASAYRDYRGVSVLGVGRWLTNLNLGLVTEIDRVEALSSYDSLRKNLVIVILVTGFVMVASGLLSITIGQRATRFMMRAKDELELKVQERTSELNDTLHDLDHSLKVQESQNKELKTLYDHVTDAHSIITSSIGYATRIQNSILPKSEAIDSFIDDYFVIWEPRDNVGGDMYWYQPWGLGKLFALGDCTGHGVPGAFMTMIANGAIEMSTLECMPGDTASLLNRTHQLIQTTLGQDEQGGESNDGLEMGVCYIPHDKSKLVFSGARFSLFIVREGEISEVKGDKRGLGYRHIAKDASFTKHEIEGLDACSIYMTTDGLLDQVGGEKRRAYGKRRFMALLAEIQDHPMASQIDTIKASLVRHQGDEIRRDDVAVIGFKLNGKSS